MAFTVGILHFDYKPFAESQTKPVRRLVHFPKRPTKTSRNLNEIGLVVIATDCVTVETH